MAQFGEELAFLKTQCAALRHIPVTFHDDYQPPLSDQPRRVPIFNIPLPAPPATKAGPSNADSDSEIELTVKSTKPALTFHLKAHTTDSISTIKSLLASQPRAPQASDQRLLLKGKVLLDSKLLKEYTLPNPLVITLMSKPGSTWDGSDVPAPVTVEPENFAAPSPSKLTTGPPQGKHGRSLSGNADQMAIPSLKLSPTASPSVDLSRAMDLEGEPVPRTRTPTAEGYHQIITDPEFWVKLLTFLKGEFRTDEDATTCWESWFLASKEVLTPTQIAKVRDVTGIMSMGG